MYFSRSRFRLLQSGLKHKRLLTSLSVPPTGSQSPHPQLSSAEIVLSNQYRDIVNITPMETEQYYDNMAKDYDFVIGSWTYDLPQQMTEVISKIISDNDMRTTIANGEPLRILDCGCGSGLVGVKLKSAFSSTFDFSITGVDLSEQMLEQAKTLKIYSELIKTDMNKNGIPLDDNSFDVLTCLGTTSYLEPEITTREWVRVAKPGALISFVHKTSVWPKWETLQEQLVKEGNWERLWVSDELPYLPGCDIFKDEQAKIYVYRKTQNS